MFRRIAQVLSSKCEYVSSLVNHAMGQYKRYRKAADKAVAAAREYLAVPSGKNVFEPLTPVLLEVDRSQRYESELLSALCNDQIRNIAITGEYGAGKSSVIRTFVDRHPELIYAFVSLAAFGKDLNNGGAGRVTSTDAPVDPANSSSNTTDPKGAEKKTESDILTRIEETIVQQLLYAVPSDELPKSRLKRIIQASSSSIWMRTIFYVLMIVSVLRLYVPTIEKLPKIDPDWLVEWLLWIPGGIAVGMMVGGGIFVLFSVLKLLSLFSIDGFTIKGGKLETTHHGSVLHKNVDEIVYCFERSKIDIVVIEDLDRFGIHDVFTRLREINFIIKQSPQIKRPVYFIYALRDELFAVGEKTKFFDLIIPIIPVVNSENSREQMFKMLRERQFKGVALDVGLNETLVETVCYLIDDMRLIKNIVNEFDMFSSILSGGSGLKLDPNKLFSIIAIRNLHPDEYAHLVKRRGAIYETIQGFSEWRFQQSKQAEDAYQALREKREQRVQEIAGNVAELRAYVWLELVKKSGIAATHVWTPSGSQFSLTDFVKDDVFESIFSQSIHLKMAINDRYGNANQAAAPFDSKQLLTSTSYSKRYDLLQRTLADIDDEMAELRIEASRINHQTFRTAAKKAYGDVITQKLNGLDIVVYLMRHGYFDTDYTDYFGYFYAGSLTSEDKNLILELRRGVSVDIATVISAPKKAAEKLDTDDLSDGRGIIVALIEYLSNCPYNDSDMSHERSKLATILRSGLGGHLDRMAQATEILISTAASQKFIQAVYVLEPGLFQALLNAERFESAVLRQALISAVMDGLEVTQLTQVNSMPGKSIYDAIASLEDVSRLMPGLEAGGKGWPWLKELPMRFSALNDSILLDDLKKLINWGCVEVNLNMLTLICQKAEPVHASKSDYSVRIISYRRLQALEIDGLNVLLLEAAEEFANTLLAQVGTLDESATSFTELLGAILEESDDSEAVDQLFDRTMCTFERLEDTTPSLWTKVLLSDRVKLKAVTVWTFFKDILVPALEHKGCETLDMEAFAGFIQRHVKEIKEELWDLNPSLHQELQRYLIAPTGLSNETLELLFTNVFLSDPGILKGLQARERWEMLANAPFLAYSPEIRESIRTFSADLEAPYLAAHWVQARDEIDLSQISIDMALPLSQSGALELKEKIQIWTALPVEAFNTNNEAVKEVAETCRVANRYSTSFPPAFIPALKKFAGGEGLTSAQRSEVLIQCLPSCSWAEAASVLGMLSEGGFTKLSPHVKKIEVPYSDLNMRVINALHTRGFVQTVTQKGDLIGATAKPKGMV
ncbi:YobI family P-loop NTPase [Pseudomonas sp. ZS001]|uniref:YobI family P-loop NTPase n=1 Tax=Pseudomonas sp. ZS001 TaxID=3138070 RepID=UPI0031396470